MCNTPITKFKYGRPRKLTAYDKRRIIRWIKKSHDTQCADCRAIIMALDLTVSENTLLKAFVELGYTRSVARCHPLLKQLDMKRTLKFAHTHKH